MLVNGVALHHLQFITSAATLDDIFLFLIKLASGNSFPEKHFSHSHQQRYTVCMLFLLAYIASLSLDSQLFEYRNGQTISGPTAVLHVIGESVKFRGYDLPKGTLVLPNIYQSHMDPAIWEDPSAFNPGRWLDEDNKLKTNPAFMPFCVGCRMCLGESLAKMEMFLFMTSLLQRFDFRVVDDNNSPTTDGIQGITRCPHKFELIACRV